MNFGGMFDRTVYPHILILTLIFVASFLGGTVAPPSLRKQMIEVFQAFMGNHGGIAGGILFFNILVQNVMATMLVILSGVIVGIVPTFAVGSNGFGLGVLFRHAAEGSGYSRAAVEVLPYGILETPALLIAASYGLWIGVLVVRRMRGKENTLLRNNVEYAFRRYFSVVFPLLVVSATIETAFFLWLR